MSKLYFGSTEGRLQSGYMDIGCFNDWQLITLSSVTYENTWEYYIHVEILKLFSLTTDHSAMCNTQEYLPFPRAPWEHIYVDNLSYSA